MSMTSKTYRSIVMGTLTLIAIIITGGVIADWYNHSIRGNRLTLDHYQTFNVAYVRGDNDTWDRIEILNWCVDNYAAGCQVVTTNGIPIYTSFNNIILTKEN